MKNDETCKNNNEKFVLTESSDQFNAIRGSNFLKHKLISFLENDNYKIFSIQGFWGSGKTTLTDFTIEKILEDPELKEEYVFLKIELWKYELLTNDLYIIINNIYESLLGESNKTFRKIIEFLFGKPIKLLVGTIPITRKIRDESSRKTAKESILKNDYDKFLMTYFEKLNKINKKIVIIFDELDRCSDKNIEKYINFIKNIVSNLSINIKVIMLMDYDYVARALCPLEFNKTVSIKSKLFLDKIIDDHYNIETFKQYKRNKNDSNFRWGDYTNDILLEFWNTNENEIERIFNPRNLISFRTKNRTILNKIFDLNRDFVKIKDELELVVFFFQLLYFNNHNLSYFWLDEFEEKNIWDNLKIDYTNDKINGTSFSFPRQHISEQENMKFKEAIKQKINEKWINLIYTINYDNKNKQFSLTKINDFVNYIFTKNECNFSAIYPYVDVNKSDRDNIFYLPEKGYNFDLNINVTRYSTSILDPYRCYDYFFNESFNNKLSVLNIRDINKILEIIRKNI